MKVYKFRPLTDEKELCRFRQIVETGHFWCSRFDEMNDPMEGIFRAEAQTAKKIFSDKNRYKICSFCGEDGFKNPSLWGYYARAFKGVAIELEVIESNLKQVFYTDKLCEVNNSNDIEKILTTKLEAWIKENEYRYIVKTEISFHKIGEITAVYFGNPYGDLFNSDSLVEQNLSLKNYSKLRDQATKITKDKGIGTFHINVESGKVKPI